MSQDREAAIAQFRRERAALIAECIALLRAVGERPGALKLLAGVREQLKMFAAYKSGREQRWNNNSKQEN